MSDCSDTVGRSNDGGNEVDGDVHRHIPGVDYLIEVSRGDSEQSRRPDGDDQKPTYHDEVHANVLVGTNVGVLELSGTDGHISISTS